MWLFFLTIIAYRPGGNSSRSGGLPDDPEEVPVAVGAEDVVLGVVQGQGFQGALAGSTVQALFVEGASPVQEIDKRFREKGFRK